MAKEEEKKSTIENGENHEATVENERTEGVFAQEDNENARESDDDELTKAKKEADELRDKYLRLYSEFENFRRRTSKEKTDLIKSANEDVLVALLPVIDDFERARKSMNESDSLDGIREGIELIFNKLYKTLESKGLKAMESPVGKEFDSEIQEAITQAPAPSEDLKGKVIDEIEKGYRLNDKVIRFAKVIIGS